MPTTREGYQWTTTSGLQAGLPCEGAIQPLTRFSGGEKVLDVLIIGAGYTGLTAARDLTTAGSFFKPSFVPWLTVCRTQHSFAGKSRPNWR